MENDEINICPFYQALWSGERSHNPEKGWITDSRGNRLSKLGNRKSLGKMIEFHNKEIEFLRHKIKKGIK